MDNAAGGANGAGNAAGGAAMQAASQHNEINRYRPLGFSEMMEDDEEDDEDEDDDDDDEEEDSDEERSGEEEDQQVIGSLGEEEDAEEMDGIVNQQMMGAEYGHEDQDVYFDEFEQAAVHGVHAGVAGGHIYQ